jgi:hypothetical protein
MLHRSHIHSPKICNKLHQEKSKKKILHRNFIINKNKNTFGPNALE